MGAEMFCGLVVAGAEKFRLQRACSDRHQALQQAVLKSSVNKDWLALSVLTRQPLSQVWMVLVEPEVSACLLLHPQSRPLAGEPSAPLWGARQPAPSVSLLHFSTPHRGFYKPSLPNHHPLTPVGTERDSRVLTQVLFSSLATWQARGLWDHPASWLPPRDPNGNTMTLCFWLFLKPT